MESKTINFRGAPCFEIHARLDQDGSVISVRALAANGHIYQLMVMGSDLPVEKRGELEAFFSAFDFIGAPNLPTPRTDSAQDLGYQIGRLTGFLLVAIVALKLFSRWRKKQA